MESELAQAQQAEAEARKGRQAAEANSEQLREESEQLRELRELREESEQLREELAKSRANWRTVVGAITALGTVAGVMVAALDWSQKPCSACSPLSGLLRRARHVAHYYEHATEGRLVTPNTSASLGTHVVTSLGSHGALEGARYVYVVSPPEVVVSPPEYTADGR